MIRPMFTLTSVLALCAGSAMAQDMNFNRIASFMVAENTPDAEETSAEIISATEDGMTLVYSDSPAGVIGFIDITDPANPVAAGAFAMPAGEPTAVAVHRHDRLCRGEHLGQLHRAFGHACTPSTWPRKASGVLRPRRAARQRGRGARRVLRGRGDRERARRGRRRRRVPQMPAGFVAIVPLVDGALDCDGMIASRCHRPCRNRAGRPRARIRRDQRRNEIVVTMQENNHMVVLAADGDGAEPLLRR
jgi:hypothetical protein